MLLVSSDKKCSIRFVQVVDIILLLVVEVYYGSGLLATHSKYYHLLLLQRRQYNVPCQVSAAESVS